MNWNVQESQRLWSQSIKYVEFDQSKSLVVATAAGIAPDARDIGSAHELEWRGDASIIAKCQCQSSNFTIALRESCRQPSQLWVSATTISFNALSWFCIVFLLNLLLFVRPTFKRVGPGTHFHKKNMQLYYYTIRNIINMLYDVCGAIMQLCVVNCCTQKWFAG